MTQPLYRYRFGENTEGSLPPAFPRGPGRTVTRMGRPAVVFDRLHSGFALTRNTLQADRGTAALWVCPLDDITSQAQHPQHREHNPGYDHYIFLSDLEQPIDARPAQFALYLHTWWHPVFMAKWARGDYQSLFWSHDRGAIAIANHMRLHRDRWQHLACSWDRTRGLYKIYVNGVLVGTEDKSYEGVIPNQPAGPVAYGGAPRTAYGEVSFYDDVLADDQVHALAHDGSYPLDPELYRETKKEHAHGEPAEFTPPDLNADGWSSQLELPLTRDEDLLAFYHQGCNNGTSVSENGLRVTTPELGNYYDAPKPPWGDQTRMYLWTRQTFEGDLYVTFEFELHRHGGLALLMTQAAGMHGEDFIHTYHPRVDGSMSMVCWEDVRNYHWEYMREMCDIRNDVATHAMLKNPWYKPMSYLATQDQWELGRTYRLHYLQRGNHILGAIDNVKVIDAVDTSWDNNGPVLRNGAVALRCMMRTDMTFRNLAIYNRSEDA